MKLEGRLAGPWVDVLDRYWRITAGPERNGLVLDLTEVTFIDRAGKELLARLHGEGAMLQASGCLTKCIVEEIMNMDRPWTASKPAGRPQGE